MEEARDTLVRIPDSDRAQQPDFSIPIPPAADHDAAAEHHEKAAHHHREAAKHQRSGQHDKADHHGKLAAEHAAKASSWPH